jgi:hypothetical protein
MRRVGRRVTLGTRLGVMNRDSARTASEYDAIESERTANSRLSLPSARAEKWRHECLTSHSGSDYGVAAQTLTLARSTTAS